MSSSTEPVSSGATTARRILSRNKPADEESSSRLKPATTAPPAVTKPPAKKENKENAETISQQQQHNLATNYINKEPFNEEIDVEEMSIVNELRWRQVVTERFRVLSADMKRLKLDPIANKAALRDKYKQGLLLCSSIKKLNRVSHTVVNKARNRTHEEKNKIDEFHLELQNLLYEISHLQKEINKCLEYRSAHEDINLVPVEEFYEKAPVEIANPDVTKANEHKLKLARLDWELIERQNMIARIKELENQILQREHEVKLKEQKLESLNPKLNLILESCKPALDYFNTNFTDECSFSEPVQYLPKPLYQFYMMMTAYRDTLDKDVQIEVCGDLDEAKRFNINDSISFDDEDSDSANEDENETDNYKKKKSKLKTTKKRSSNRDKLFNVYPLTCKVALNIKNCGTLSLEFSYLSILKIVTVKVEYKLLKEIPFTDNSILRSDTILTCLYPNDDGCESPNLSNKFLFSNMGVRSLEPYLKSIGTPYRWCQIVCGLNYENKSDQQSILFRLESATEKEQSAGEEKTNEEVGKVAADQSDVDLTNGDENEQQSDFVMAEPNHQDEVTNESKLFEQIINRLKARFRARVRLQEILNSLKNGNVPQSEANSIERLRFKVQSSLVGCKEITFERYASYPFTKHLIDSGLVNEDESSFFEVAIQNASAQMQALIVVNQDYPRVAPMFSVNINWKHDRNYTNDEAVRDMEREINIFRENFASEDSGGPSRKSAGGEDKNYDLLAKQFNHLLFCYDIYLESESYFLKDYEFQRVKLFTQSVRGRDRKRPYSYLASKDIFVQRMQFGSSDATAKTENNEANN